MTVRIYQPSKSAMQSGKAGTRDWILEYAPTSTRRPEPLMGWVSSSDTQEQIRLSFDSKEQAMAYARKHGLAYTVRLPKQASPRPRAYADNFSYFRVDAWTH